MPTPPSYFVNRQETSFDARARKILNGEPITSDEDFEQLAESLSPDQIKVLFEKGNRSEQEKADQQRSREDADAFIKLHPEVRDTTKNAHQLRAHTMSAFGTAHPSLQQLEAAYPALRANGLLDINQAELARQADTASTSRANTIREEAFDEATCDGLDLDEIKRRANAVLRRR
jgi:hypothetical protein